jgi:hypothetical protein
LHPKDKVGILTSFSLEYMVLGTSFIIQYIQFSLIVMKIDPRLEDVGLGHKQWAKKSSTCGGDSLVPAPEGALAEWWLVQLKKESHCRFFHPGPHLSIIWQFSC